MRGRSWVCHSPLCRLILEVSRYITIGYLKKVIDPKTWKPIQERLLDHADADRALKNPSRVMRLAGTYHMKDDGKRGGMTKIIFNSNKKYSYKDIESCLTNTSNNMK